MLNTLPGQINLFFHYVNDAIPDKSIEEPTGSTTYEIPKYSCNF